MLSGCMPSPLQELGPSKTRLLSRMLSDTSVEGLQTYSVSRLRLREMWQTWPLFLRNLYRPTPEWVPKKNKTNRPFSSLSMCQPITHCVLGREGGI